MTDMEELKKRKMPLNLAIVHVDPDAFIDNFMGWLEITAFITAQRAGEAEIPADGMTPKLPAEKLRNGGVHNVGNDAIFAFCMTAAMKGDKPAVDKVEAALVETMGKEFPGSFGLWHFRATIDAPVTLEDFVGQAGKKLLAGDRRRRSEQRKIGTRVCASSKRPAKPISSTRLCIPWRYGPASAGQRPRKKVWHSSITLKTIFQSYGRLWKRPAMMNPSLPICC
jgi:hypothetical protein